MNSFSQEVIDQIVSSTKSDALAALNDMEVHGDDTHIPFMQIDTLLNRDDIDTAVYVEVFSLKLKTFLGVVFPNMQQDKIDKLVAKLSLPGATIDTAAQIAEGKHRVSPIFRLNNYTSPDSLFYYVEFRISVPSYDQSLTTIPDDSKIFMMVCERIHKKPEGSIYEYRSLTNEDLDKILSFTIPCVVNDKAASNLH